MNNAPNIRLRAIEPEDLDLLYRIENDRALWNVGATNVPYSRYTLHDYIATSTADIYADKQVRMIVETQAGEAVGICDLTNFDPRHLRAEVGIVIMDHHRQQGYAQSAIQQLCLYALSTLHLHQLYVIIDEHNQAALQLFRSSGFSTGLRLKEWLYDGHNYYDGLIMQRFL